MNSWFLFLEPTVAEVVNKKNIILLKYLLILSLSVMLYSLSFLIFLYLSPIFLFWPLFISSLSDWHGEGRRQWHAGVWLCTEASSSLTLILSLLAFSHFDSLFLSLWFSLSDCGFGFWFCFDFLLWVLVHCRFIVVVGGCCGGGEDGFTMGLWRWLWIWVAIG